MNTIVATQNWLNTDVIQGKIMVSFGITLAAGVIIIFLSNNLLIKGSLIPIVLLSLIFLTYGLNLIITNPKKLSVYTTSFVNNAEEFKTSEKVRVKKLVDSYFWNKIVWLIILIIGGGMGIILDNNYFKGLGLGLILFGASAFVADNFLQYSAKVYYSHLMDNS